MTDHGSSVRDITMLAARSSDTCDLRLMKGGFVSPNNASMTLVVPRTKFVDI